jgi:hypothetical protein
MVRAYFSLLLGPTSSFLRLFAQQILITHLSTFTGRQCGQARFRQGDEAAESVCGGECDIRMVCQGRSGDCRVCLVFYLRCDCPSFIIPSRLTTLYTTANEAKLEACSKCMLLDREILYCSRYASSAYLLFVNSSPRSQALESFSFRTLLTIPSVAFFSPLRLRLDLLLFPTAVSVRRHTTRMDTGPCAVVL